ncbi:hypothetical protein [Hominifimenecus sp. rT4P-3]|uniref:hypothetical protein n=1 Tax=Hominifimenecus sp. rT4P-3 TaxID=3242979 RepID=UPI003DA571EB
MNAIQIQKPIGLGPVCTEIEKVCKNAYRYKRCGLKPDHLLIPLDAGEGRTTLVEYLTDMYKEHGVLSFASGLDDYIEISFDGTLHQLKQAFSAIDSAAVYENEYANVIGMDITNLSLHMNETQFGEFMSNCKRICENACVLFFVHSEPTKNEERLMEKLCETIDHIKWIRVKPYTEEEICRLMEKRMEECGIELENHAAVHAVFLEMARRFPIATVSDALAVADELIHVTDFSGLTPVLREYSLTAWMKAWYGEKERREVK